MAINHVRGDAERRVVPFRSRADEHAVQRPPTAKLAAGDQPVSDLAKFERVGGQDNYRHRMVVNLLAMVFTAVLIAAGIWLATSLATLRKHQDCVLMGLRSCTIVETPASDRWTAQRSGR